MGIGIKFNAAGISIKADAGISINADAAISAFYISVRYHTVPYYSGTGAGSSYPSTGLTGCWTVWHFRH